MENKENVCIAQNCRNYFLKKISENTDYTDRMSKYITVQKCLIDNVEISNNEIITYCNKLVKS